MIAVYRTLQLRLTKSLNRVILIVITTIDMKRQSFSLETSIAYQAYLLSRALRKDFFGIAKRAGYDLFPEQWFALYFIVNNPGQSQRELASHAFEDRPSLSRSLKSMVDKGLIKTKKDATDGRSVRYTASAKGIEVYDQLVKTMTLERERVFKGLDESDYREFSRIAKILMQNMG